MTTAWKTVRVFISSTFRDMQAERDHLVRFVFPRLREQLLPRRIHLVDVDLRWGVTSEQDASEVCREVINECRPRFLCMLGGRYGTIPEGNDLSITADEVHFGVLGVHHEKIYALFYFRNGAVTELMDKSSPGSIREPRHSEKAVKLARLKRDIRKAKHRPFLFRPRWNADEERLLDLRTFGDRVERDILATIDDEFGGQTPVQFDEFAEENAAMEAFVEERSERFVLGSRETVLEELLAHANASGGEGYVFLIGAPGSGKSALLAHLSRHSTFNERSSTLLIRHFVGASAGSTDIRRTLRRLCHELKAGCPNITAEIPDDPEELRVAFLEFLRQACAKKRAVILLDAVNQFDTTSHFSGLHWLPEDLPANARFILSSLDGPTLKELRRRPRTPREVELKPLTENDGEAIIEQFRRRYRKRFEPDQRTALLAKTDAGTPLYLLTALEELRTLGTYEEITGRIAALPPTTQELFAWILQRLENDDGFRDTAGRRVGHRLVSCFAALLGATRHGLSQRELSDLLDSGDPLGNVAALLHLLRPYLMRRGELLDFYHGQFRSAAEEAWLRTDTQREAAHAQLAAYFRNQADPGKSQTWDGESARPFLELSFHLAKSNPEELVLLLFDLNWLQAKTNKTLVQDMIQDYAEALHVLRAEHPQRYALELVRDALRLSAHTLDRGANHLPPQLLGRLTGCEQESVQSLLRMAIGSKKGLWLRPTTASLTVPGGPVVRIIPIQGDEVKSLAVTPDGHIAIAGSWSEDVLRVWDLETGQLLRTLRGHRRDVSCVAMVPNRNQVVSGCFDHTLRLWDLETGETLRVLRDNDEASPFCVAITPDGSNAVAGLSDNDIAVWDLQTGELLRKLRGHARSVSAVAITPDGCQVVSGSFDEALLLWDLEGGQLLRVLEGQCGEVHSIAISSDGLIAVSGSGIHDCKLRVWNLRSGQMVRELAGHTDAVNSVALTPDGKQAVSASADFTIRIWCLESGEILQKLKVHEMVVTALSMTRDGRRLVSASRDGTLRILDLERGLSWTPGQGRHEDCVTCVATASNQPVAVTAANDDTLRIWDTERGELLQTRNCDFVKGWVTCVAITPDGQYAISGSRGHRLHIWRLPGGEMLGDIPTHEQDVEGLAISSDGRFVVTASYDHTLRVMDLASGRTMRLEGHTDSVNSVALTHDGRRAVSGSTDLSLRIWDLESGVQLETLNGHDEPVECVAVTPCGNYAVSGSWDGSLRLWDINTCRSLYAYQLHDDWIHSLAITPNGRWIVTGSGDRRVRICDLKTGKPVTEFIADAGVIAVAVTPDGRTVVAGDALGYVHFLRLGI